MLQGIGGDTTMVGGGIEEDEKGWSKWQNNAFFFSATMIREGVMARMMMDSD